MEYADQSWGQEAQVRETCIGWSSSAGPLASSYCLPPLYSDVLWALRMAGTVVYSGGGGGGGGDGGGSGKKKGEEEEEEGERKWRWNVRYIRAGGKMIGGRRKEGQIMQQQKKNSMIKRRLVYI